MLGTALTRALLTDLTPVLTMTVLVHIQIWQAATNESDKRKQGDAEAEDVSLTPARGAFAAQHGCVSLLLWQEGAPQKRSRAEEGGSTGLALEPLYIEWRRIDPGKPHYHERQLVYEGPATPFATTDTLAEELAYTDADSCALDAFNSAVGQPVLTRESVGAPTGHACDDLSHHRCRWLEASASLTIVRRAARRPVNFDEHEGAPRKAVRAAGFDLKAVTADTTKAKKKKQRAAQPTFEQILGQRAGVFVVEFKWCKPGTGEFHAVAINCDQRRVFCNTLGVVPFHRADRANETAATHVRDSLRRTCTAARDAMRACVLRRASRPSHLEGCSRHATPHAPGMGDAAVPHPQRQPRLSRAAALRGRRRGGDRAALPPPPVLPRKPPSPLGLLTSARVVSSGEPRRVAGAARGGGGRGGRGGGSSARAAARRHGQLGVGSGACAGMGLSRAKAAVVSGI